jgi:hypothetical protein
MFKIIGADQKQYGPISVEQIRQWIRDGRLTAQTSAQRVGESEWQPLAAYEEFADLFQPAAGPGDPTTAGPAGGSAYSAMPGSVPSGSREAALSAVKGPAIALIVTSVLGIAAGLINGFRFLALRGMAPQTTQNVPAGFQWFSRALGPLQFLFVIVAGFILCGALKMLNLQNHRIAFIACIVALLPCSGCCILSLPFGIWGLVVLNKPDVKSQFS